MEEYLTVEEVAEILKIGKKKVSQFHQGAGEDATLDLFKLLQTIPDQSLLIIDEVEASLHPSAQRRLIQYLLKLARIKKIQVILSTHSTHVLDEIPPEGRIMLLEITLNRVKAMYGVFWLKSGVSNV